MLAALLRLTHVKATVQKDSFRLRPSDSPTLYGNNAKIYKDTGWKPEIKLEQTLLDVLSDWRN
jgi:GDP-4-dehydro-6-deoxy-D-mannose reductase